MLQVLIILTSKKKDNFTSNTLFRWSISQINNTFTGNAENLDIIIPMLNLWYIYINEVNDDGNENNDDNIEQITTWQQQSNK